MSGIVRGWTDASELRDLVEYRTWAKVFTDKDERMLDGPPIPVAVVPLDDATLAGMAETMARIEFDAASQQRIATWSWETLPETYKRTFLEHEVRKIRAALGLEGGA